MRVFKKLRLAISRVVPSFAATFQPITDDFERNSFLLSAMKSGSVAEFVSSAFKIAIVLGAMFAVLRIGYAGFLYMTTDVIGDKGRARSILTSTTLGLVLLLGVFLILNQINPEILKLKILSSEQSAPEDRR